MWAVLTSDSDTCGSESQCKWKSYGLGANCTESAAFALVHWWTRFVFTTLVQVTRDLLIIMFCSYLHVIFILFPAQKKIPYLQQYNDNKRLSFVFVCQICSSPLVEVATCRWRRWSVTSAGCRPKRATVCCTRSRYGRKKNWCRKYIRRNRTSLKLQTLDKGCVWLSSDTRFNQSASKHLSL